MRVLTTILMAMAACAVGLGCIPPAIEAGRAWPVTGDEILANGAPALV